jgi:hypothetical protein
VVVCGRTTRACWPACDPESLIVRSDEIGFEAKLKDVVTLTRATIDR